MTYWLAALMLTAACSGDHADRAISDAAFDPDAGAIDAPPASPMVTVQTIPAIAGEPVYFQAADSSLVAKVMTDAGGKASAAMTAGGFATIVHTIPGDAASDPPTYRLYTWGGVKPGDVIQVNPGGGEGSGGAQLANVTVKLPVATGGKTYELDPSCGSVTVTPPAGSATTFTATIATPCTTIDLMVIARAANQAIVSSFVASDLAITNGATIDLSASTYAAPTTRSITVRHWTGSQLRASTFIESNGTPLYYDGLTLAADDPSTTMQTLPAKPAAHRDVTWISGTTGTSTPYVYQWGEDGNISVDWTADATPAFGSAIAFDATTHVASWTAATSAAAVNASGVGVYLVRPTYAFQWNAYGAGPTSVTLPVVPTDIADFSITSADPITYAIMAAFPGGYDALRPLIGTGEPYPPASLVSGKLAFTSYNAILAR